MDAQMATDLVQGALMKAIHIKRPARGLICHSDPGAQYCAQADQATLGQFGMIVGRAIAMTARRWRVSGGR